MKPLLLLDNKIKLSKKQFEKLFDYEVRLYSMQEKELELWQKANVILLHSKLSDDRIEQLNECNYIGIRAHNLDYVNQQLVAQKKIILKGIPPVGQQAVAEHTFALIFAVAKQLKKSQNNLENNLWREGLGFNFQLHGKTLGIVGNGAIGQAVGKMAKAFGLKVLIATRKTVNEVLKISDIVSLHIPSTVQNKDFIDQKKLELLKPSAILINTSRGDILDYEALTLALQSKKLAGVGLDVFPSEPPLDLELLKYENVVATPHVAFNTLETVEEMNNNLVHILLENKDL